MDMEGVIFDHACGLDAYILNREPREFQFLRCLVDGSHWQGQKQLKKPNKSGKGGHLGCSEGFNFNIYKVSSGILLLDILKEFFHILEIST